MSQLAYTEQAVAFAGLMADITDGYERDTMLNGEASAEIPFGAFVVENAAMTAGATPATRGTPAIAKLPAASTDDFANGGVVLHSHEYDKRLDLGTTGVLPTRQLSVLKRGRVWMQVEQAVVKTDPVFVRYTVNGAGTALGQVRKDDDTAKALRIYGARFVTETTGAGLVQVEIDMSAHRAH
jgi:hypothetical protein